MSGPSVIKPQQGACLATFSAAFFSDSGLSPITTGNGSVQEIMTIKLEHDALPFVSDSTNVEDLVFAAAPESPSESAPLPASHMPGGLDTATNEDSVSQNTGNGRKMAPIGKENRKASHSRRRIIPASNRNAQTKSTGSGGFRLIKIDENNAGLNPSSGMQSDSGAYTQSFFPPLQEDCVSTPSTHPILARTFPPQQSRIVTPDHAMQFTARGPSTLSGFNIPMDVSRAVESSLSARAATVCPSAQFASKDVAVSFVPPHRDWRNVDPLICSPRDTQSTKIAAEAQTATHASCSVYAAPSAENRLSKASPLIASGLPNFYVTDSAVDSFVENSSVIVSPCLENGLTVSLTK